MNIIDFMKSHKVASAVLALTLVAGAGVQVWIYHDKEEKAAAAEIEKQSYMAELEAAEELQLEKEQAEREALIKSIEEDPIVLPQKRESKVQPKEEPEPIEETTEPKEAEEEVVTEAKEIKKPELPEDAVTDDPEKHPEYKPEDNVIKDEPSEPADGTLREDGYVYIKGFGWIPPSAGVKGDIAHNSGTGEIIGQMG